MKVELCSFSRYKICPGHWLCYARNDGKAFQFLNAKCESGFLSKRNPQQINWTILYRRKHRKGQLEEIQKKRTLRDQPGLQSEFQDSQGYTEKPCLEKPKKKKRNRHAIKFQRAITGASLADKMAKRNQKPEVRTALREQAIRAAKEAKKAKQASNGWRQGPKKAAPKQKM